MALHLSASRLGRGNKQGSNPYAAQFLPVRWRKIEVKQFNAKQGFARDNEAL
jgi:hypothetical protein